MRVTIPDCRLAIDRTYLRHGWLRQVVLDFAAVAVEAAAVSNAVLVGDLDEAGFRANLLAAKADIAGLSKVAAAAADLVLTLGPAGVPPRSGCGANLIRVANELDAAPKKIS